MSKIKMISLKINPKFILSCASIFLLSLISWAGMTIYSTAMKQAEILIKIEEIIDIKNEINNIKKDFFSEHYRRNSNLFRNRFENFKKE